MEVEGIYGRVRAETQETVEKVDLETECFPNASCTAPQLLINQIKQDLSKIFRARMPFAPFKQISSLYYTHSGICLNYAQCNKDSIGRLPSFFPLM